MAATIKQFQGEHRFLSNFWPCVVYFEGIQYPTIEHAYQAAKFFPADRAGFLTCGGPGKAKALAKIMLKSQRPNVVKLEVMAHLLRQKFHPTQNPALHELLKATGDAVLEEGNHWGDTFWGVDLRHGHGQNHMGKLLMEVRASFNQSQSPA